MRLSVVVPTLDERETLPGLFDSLDAAASRLASVDARLDGVCVVDGGSGDGTAEIAAERGAHVLAAPRGRGSQLRAGAAHAAAAGASESDGSRHVLVFLHADMRIDEGALASVVDAFRANDWCAAGMRQRVAGSRRAYRWIERAADARVRRGMVYGDSGLCVRRRAYESVGGFRAQPIFEDVDLSRRLRRHGRVGLIEGARLEIAARRWERDGIVRRSVANWCLTAAYLAGVSPERLAGFYGP